jgi:hypothetical protein
VIRKMKNPALVVLAATALSGALSACGSGSSSSPAPGSDNLIAHHSLSSHLHLPQPCPGGHWILVDGHPMPEGCS